MIIRDLGEIAGSPTSTSTTSAAHPSALPVAASAAVFPSPSSRRSRCSSTARRSPIGGSTRSVRRSAVRSASGSVGATGRGSSSTGARRRCSGRSENDDQTGGARRQALRAVQSPSARRSTRGDPIAKVSIDSGETVMSCLRNMARKRAVLLVSDGSAG